ncbi:Hsp70 family protein [Piscinibacter koreensis]|uniref:Hsp70 family protein n=1 Tax=Piscinibacter koreensis TaxID=2742824 RepID=A0A7Y6NJH5_9BURK|nr:Hsp70 family protein [Schlegelella koreensis]NUZ04302.1 Hsp70 family protein [Schlegelella koreensis]
MYCAIDFGTSNSAIAIPDPASPGAMRLVELEPGQTTIPTAVFYGTEGAGAPQVAFGRAALAAYVEGSEGRLMRSMKSILGSDLVERTTEIGGGRGVRYLDVIAGYLRHLRTRAEAAAGARIAQAVLGRPVFFVDDDAARDAAAERALREAAALAGFRHVEFQFEPIAAALDHERGTERDECVLVADIGGGTSDFALVRVGPSRRDALDRRRDILASHGVHVAGTDFDRRVELGAILPLLGYRAYGPATASAPAREVPSAVYFDLATWHLINTVYAPQRVAELRAMRPFYADPAQHRRLMTVVDERLGHDLAARAEAAKIAVSEHGGAHIDLGLVERRLAADVDQAAALGWLEGDLARIVDAARQTVADAGLAPGDVDTVYLTGGSTGLGVLAERIGAAFPAARTRRGERFASVASGLALHAERRFGTPAVRASDRLHPGSRR